MKLTCIVISHGGGAPSGMPRASFNSCDKEPGFISLSFTCKLNRKTQVNDTTHIFLNYHVYHINRIAFVSRNVNQATIENTWPDQSMI